MITQLQKSSKIALIWQVDSFIKSDADQYILEEYAAVGMNNCK